LNKLEREYIHILAVDDEKEILDSYAKSLLSFTKSEEEEEMEKLEAKLFETSYKKTYIQNFKLKLCSQGTEAVRTVAKSIKNNDPFAVVFLDMRLPPGPDGLWTAEEIRKIDPYIIIVIVTAYSDIHPDKISEKVLPPHRLFYIEKPFSTQEILQFSKALGRNWQIDRELRHFNQKLENLVEKRTEELEISNQSLQESEKRLQDILNFLQTGIVVIDKDKHIVLEANPTAIKMLCSSREKIIGSIFSNYVFRPEKDLYSRTGQGQTLGSFEKLLLTQKGEKIPVIISVTSVTLEGREVILANFLDITELKEVEKEKEILKAQLFQVQKLEALGTLAGGIAHDFNNILGSIMGFAELSLCELSENSQIEYNLKKILESSHRAKELIKQILIFSRQAKQERKPLIISSIAKGAIQLVRATIPATIKVKENIEAQNKLIVADPTQIHQIIMNLCANASHAMGKKAGVLDVSISEVKFTPEPEDLYEEIEKGKYIKLTVKDTGCGMDKKVTKKIFDPFFTTKKPNEGTGLGLSVVHGIVKSYKGKITVDSEPGKGTTFSVYFPLFDREKFLEIKSSNEIPRGSYYILFVDDEDHIVEMGKKLLEKLGNKVITSNNPIDAIKLFYENPDKFDIVITDHTMPNMTGIELALKLFAKKPDIPVILCTGYSESINRKKALSMGVKEFIMKPYSRRKIAQTIKTVMSGKF